MRITLGLSVCALFTFGGCFGDSDSNCEYWVTNLDKGTKEQQAIEKVGELKCTEGMEPLKKRFDAGSQFRREILTSVQILFNTGELTEEQRAAGIEIVRGSLPDLEVGSSAITLAIKFGVSSIKEDLSKLIRRQKSAKTRKQAVEALTELLNPPRLVLEGEQAASVKGVAGRDMTNLSFQLKHDANPDKHDVAINTDDNVVTVTADLEKATAADLAQMLKADVEASQTVAIEYADSDKKSDTAGKFKLKGMDKPQALERVITDTTLIRTLTWVVVREPTMQEIETNQYAADRLAEVDWKLIKDETLVNAAAQNLVKALFMKDAKNNSAQLQARFALRVLGAPAVDPILTAYQGDNTELNEFADSRGIKRWKYMQGRELVEMLWDVGDSRATPALMKSIALPLDPPPSDVAVLPEEQREEWKLTNQSRLSMIALTVGALPNDKAVPYAVELLKKKDPPLSPHQFVQAGYGLALMGTPAARKALWKLFTEGGNIDEISTQIATLKESVKGESNEDKKRELMKEHDTLIDKKNELLQTRANFVTNLAVGLHYKEIDDFKKHVMDQEKGPIADSSKQPLPHAYYTTVAECRDTLDCYVKKLQALEGKLNSIPAAMDAAQATLSTEKKRVAEKAKPITAKIKEQGKAYKAAQKAALETQAKLREMGKELEGLKGKAAEAKRAEYNAAVGDFNKAIEGLDEFEKVLDGFYKERNEVLAELDPLKKALQDETEKVHTVEKVMLMLGMLEGGGEHLKLLSTLFHEAKHPMFAQLRQFALITLEHVADKPHIATLKELLNNELGEQKKQSLWTLRLDSLIQRVERR